MASPIIPISAEYLARGSLQYEFSTETLWSPIQLMRISNPQAQVRTYLCYYCNFSFNKFFLIVVFISFLFDWYAFR